MPTLREQGVDVEFENWRSVVAPPGVAGEDRRRLELLMDRMVQSEEWRDALTRYRWLDRYLSGPAFSDFVDSEEARVQAILRKFNAGRDNPDTLASAGPYPLLVLAGLLLTGFAATLQTRRSSRVPQNQNTFALSSLALLAAGIVLNVFLAESAGFVVASAALFWYARAFDARRPVRDAVFMIALSVAACCCSRACFRCSCRRVSWDAGSDMVETLEALGHGFSNALTLPHLLWALAGVTVGTAVGVLPGIGPA